MPAQKSVSVSFKKAWVATYPWTGFVDRNESMKQTNAKSGGLARLETKAVANSRQDQPLVYITSFIGLSNRVRQAALTDSGDQNRLKKTDLLLNFIGWPVNPGIVRKVAALIFMPLTVAWHALKVPFTIATNLVKLFTEFLPLLAFTALREKATDFKEKEGFAKVAYYGLTGLAYAFRGLHFIGRAITSPAVSAMAPYRMYKDKKIPAAVGVLLTALSIGITVSVYTLLLPLGVKYLAVNVLPMVAAKLPAAVMSAATTVYQALAPMMSVFAKVGQFFMPALQAVGIAAMPSAVVGATSMFGATASTVGVGVQKVSDKIKGSMYDIFRQTGANTKRKLPQSESQSQSEPEPEPQQPEPEPQPEPQPELQPEVDDLDSNPNEDIWAAAAAKAALQNKERNADYVTASSDSGGDPERRYSSAPRLNSSS